MPNRKFKTIIFFYNFDAQLYFYLKHRFKTIFVFKVCLNTYWGPCMVIMRVCLVRIHRSTAKRVPLAANHISFVQYTTMMTYARDSFVCKVPKGARATRLNSKWAKRYYMMEPPAGSWYAVRHSIKNNQVLEFSPGHRISKAHSAPRIPFDRFRNRIYVWFLVYMELDSRGISFSSNLHHSSSVYRMRIQAVRARAIV